MSVSCGANLPQEWNILHRPTALGLWWRSSKTWSSSLAVPWRFFSSGRWQEVTCFVITLVDIQSNDRKTRCTKNFMLEDYSLCFPYLFINPINHFQGMFFSVPTHAIVTNPCKLFASPLNQSVFVRALCTNQSKLPALFIAISAEVRAGF